MADSVVAAEMLTVAKQPSVGPPPRDLARWEMQLLELERAAPVLVEMPETAEPVPAAQAPAEAQLALA